jgi:hypothetical protein
MIFSKEKWNKSEELKQHVQVSRALSFESMASSLRNAYDLFIVPLLGEEMRIVVEGIYSISSTPPPSEPVGEEPEEEQDVVSLQEELLRLLQMANANLAFWYDFDEFNVRTTDAGFQRQETDDFKSLFQYQERNLRESFRTKGFNGLDRALAYMEAHIDVFPAFKESSAYSFRKTAIVPSADVASKFYHIEGSRLVFLRLLPHLDFIQQTDVRSTLGNALYDHFLSRLSEEDVSEDEQKDLDYLRELIGRAMVLGAVHRLLLDGGRLTDRGLYFSGQDKITGSGQTDAAASSSGIYPQLGLLLSDFQKSLVLLANAAKGLFPEYSAANPHQAYDRDNDYKHTFFV